MAFDSIGIGAMHSATLFAAREAGGARLGPRFALFNPSGPPRHPPIAAKREASNRLRFIHASW